MRNKLICKLLLLFSLSTIETIHGYEFQPIEIETFAGYRQDELSFSLSGPIFSQKNVFREQIEPIKLWQIGMQARYSYAPSLYGKFIWTYGQEFNINGKTALIRKAQNQGGSVSQEISQTGRSQFTGQNWQTMITVGYAGLFGPIAFAPNVGFSYENQHLKRRDLLTFPFINATIQATTGAYPFIDLDLYTGVFGIDFIFQFEAMSRTQLRVGYNYKMGTINISSSYFIDSILNETSPTQTTGRNIKTDLSIDRFVYVNELHIDYVIGITDLILGNLTFDYAYRRGKVGDATEKNHGSEILTSGGTSTPINIDNQKMIPFSGLKWQSFTGTTGLIIQF